MQNKVHKIQAPPNNNYFQRGEDTFEGFQVCDLALTNGNLTFDLISDTLFCTFCPQIIYSTYLWEASDPTGF